MALAAAYLVASCGPALAQGAGVGTGRIGNALEVRGEVESNVQGRAYPLQRGGNVYFQQWINTREASRAGLGLLDESRVTVGPNSRVKLDKSKFDPAKQRGIVSMRIKVGEGRINTTATDNATYQVHTASGTLTIRPKAR